MEGVVMPLQTAFWRNKRVLLTGHTGFKGSWLALWLQRLGAQVTGLALAPATSPHLFGAAGIAQGMSSHFGDLRDVQVVADQVRAAQPEIVFHLAAQALVRASYADPLATYATNVMGTAHLLEALRGQGGVQVAVMVTTDKVYRNQEQPYPYREHDPLGGHDPYSASKAASEIVIASYRDAFLASQGESVASARAGNVIGGGDWSCDRLIPDAVRAWQAGQTLVIRSPLAIRPWQHVIEPLAGYLQLAQTLWDQPQLAGAYNFGPPTHAAATVECVVEMARSAYGSGMASYEKNSNDNNLHEAHLLTLETAKARAVLGIEPCWTLAQTVGRSMAWYRAQHDGANARDLCLADLEAFEVQP